VSPVDGILIAVLLFEILAFLAGKLGANCVRDFWLALYVKCMVVSSANLANLVCTVLGAMADISLKLDCINFHIIWCTCALFSFTKLYCDFGNI
jgi:hypothetical protein